MGAIHFIGIHDCSISLVILRDSRACHVHWCVVALGGNRRRRPECCARRLARRSHVGVDHLGGRHGFVSLPFSVMFRDSRICRNELRYYPRQWSKKARVIPYETITKCVFINVLTEQKKMFEHGNKILLYHKNAVILNLQIYAKLCAEFIKRLDDKKVFFRNSKMSLRTVDRYFALDFRALPYEQQQKLLKYYCDYVKFKGEKTGEELLRKKR